MKITIRLFAQLRLQSGTASVTLELPEGATVSTALDRFFADYPGLSPYRPTLLSAVDLDYAAPGQPLRDGQEIALIPPVQGG